MEPEHARLKNCIPFDPIVVQALTQPRLGIKGSIQEMNVAIPTPDVGLPDDKLEGILVDNFRVLMALGKGNPPRITSFNMIDQIVKLSNLTTFTSTWKLCFLYTFEEFGL